MTIAYTTMDSPLGRLWLATTEHGLCCIRLPAEEEGHLLTWLSRRVEPQQPVEDPAALAAALTQLREYFSRLRQGFTLDLDLRGTPFQLAVWAELLHIPYGTTITYGELARRLGREVGSARAVGSAVGANPVPIVVPCHRVIGNDRSLVGYGGGLDVKAALLRLEGACPTPEEVER